MRGSKISRLGVGEYREKTKDTLEGSDGDGTGELGQQPEETAGQRIHFYFQEKSDRNVFMAEELGPVEGSDRVWVRKRRYLVDQGPRGDERSWKGGLGKEDRFFFTD